MSDAAEYRASGDRLLEQALRTEDAIERGRLISAAATWHMMAVDLERGPAFDPEYLELDLDLIPPPAPQAKTDEA